MIQICFNSTKRLLCRDCKGGYS